MAKKITKFSEKNNQPIIRLPKAGLDGETKKGILIVCLLALGMVSFLSLFALAGSIGTYLARAIIFLFGWGRWLVPIALIGWGYLLFNEDKYRMRGYNYLGLLFLAISLEILFHIFLEQSTWREAVGKGAGGGWAGFFLASTFVKFLGFWAGLVTVLGLLLISLMLAFNAPLTKLVGRESWLAYVLHPIFIIKKIFKREPTAEGNEKDEEDEGEGEVEYEEYEIEEEADGEEEKVPGNFIKKKISPLPEFASVSEEIPDRKEKNLIEGKIKHSGVKIDLPFDLLNDKVGKPLGGDIKNNMLVIQRTLENFGIAVEMGEVNVGPTVTQYTFKPAEGVKLSRVTNLGNDLALALASHPIRIEAPIPGKSLVGVEAPNQAKAIVGLREILSDKDFKARKNNLMIALGKDVSGRAWLYDLSKMPHLLVAGATNSGKSVCLNSIIVSLLYQNNPDDLRFIMVDPKRVELPVYNGIPHLLTPVITDVSKTINALKWCLNEMDRRFEILARNGKRNISSYNEALKKGEEKMPYLVFIIDELADLMVAAAKDIEAGVIRLAQMARAVGIHLVLATQRPSVDVITGLIKANMPARIAFSVASGTDSRTILDSLGAEKLLGQGDMLFVTAELSKPKRIQGAYLSDLEIKKIVRYIKERGGEPDYIEGVTDRQKVKGVAGVGIDGASDDDDELLASARDLVLSSGKASASFLQRRLSVGYARAARLLDLLEEEGTIGPVNGAKPREILISQDQYDNIMSQGMSGTPLHKREESEPPAEFLPTEDVEDVEDDEDIEDDGEDNKDTKNDGENNKDAETESFPSEDDKNSEENVETKNFPSEDDGNNDEKNKDAEAENFLSEDNEKNGGGADDDEGKYFSK